MTSMRLEEPTAEAGLGDRKGEDGPARGNLGVIARTLEHHINDRYPIDEKTRNDVIETAKRLMRSGNERVVAAALRVLLMADQVNVRRERNEIAEEGTALAASTARLRVALGSQEGREALAAVTAAVCGPAKTPMIPPVLDDDATKQHADASACSPEVNGVETGDYASFGGPRYRKENVTGELPKPQ